jgi:hypothetical protein
MCTIINATVKFRIISKLKNLIPKPVIKLKPARNCKITETKAEISGKGNPCQTKNP